MNSRVNHKPVELRHQRITSALQNRLGVRLALGIVASVLFFWLFVVIAEATLKDQAIAQVDIVVAQELRTVMTRSLLRFFRIVTAFGYQVVIVVGLGVGVYLLLARQWIRLAVWISALAGGALLNTLLKMWFAHPRPVVAQPQLVTISYGFPSGHALMAFITYGLLAYFLSTMLPHRWQRILVISSLILLVLFIGFSRLYLAVHYSSDVLAGFAIGGMWLSICITIMRFFAERRTDKQKAV